MTIRQQGVLIAAAIVVFIYAVLAVANIAPLNNQCEWKFPKFLSCLLGARENLTGGLIGGAGALFAAWVAWLAVRQQIAFEREKRRDAELDNLWRQLQYARSDLERAEKEVVKLERSIEVSLPLVARFEVIDNNNLQVHLDVISELTDNRALESNDEMSSAIRGCIAMINIHGKFPVSTKNMHDILDARDSVLKFLKTHNDEKEELTASRAEAGRLRAQIAKLESEFEVLEAKELGL
jgi:hypothetical protein